ncbi:hypothetical protein PFISCL1PPCAC_11127, partial [Pristionchus fissidentatus]
VDNVFIASAFSFILIIIIIKIYTNIIIKINPSLLLAAGFVFCCIIQGELYYHIFHVNRCNIRYFRVLCTVGNAIISIVEVAVHSIAQPVQLFFHRPLLTLCETLSKMPAREEIRVGFVSFPCHNESGD